MRVSSTEIQNNFGKYLMLSAKEDIIITKNGMEVAKLTTIDSRAPKITVMDGSIREEAPEYICGGHKASYEEFLELARESEYRYEYIDGEIYMLASPKTAHQIAVTRFFVTFYNWFQNKPCSPMIAPYDITLKRHQDDINIVQPDIMVICDLEEKVNENGYYMGVPTLVIEVISDSTRSRDLTKKLDLYMSCGVKEYWIVNPANMEVAIYQFREKNIINNATYKKTETAKSFIFDGLTIKLDKIFGYAR